MIVANSVSISYVEYYSEINMAEHSFFMCPRHHYKNINHQVSNFFSYNVLKKKGLNKKYKIITALSMFYDLKSPNNFVRDIKKILILDG